MELNVVKILSALFLWILSLCFGLMIPFLIWKSRSRHRCQGDHVVVEEDNDVTTNTVAPGTACSGGPKTSFQRIGETICKYDVISLLNCFCGGLFIGISLLELLPQSRDDVIKVTTSSKIETAFPVTEFLVASGLLLVMFIENLVTDLCMTSQSPNYDVIDPAQRRSDSDAERRLQGDAMRKEGARALILIAVLSVHSIFEGLALGLETGVSPLIQLLLAVSVHKSVIAFGIGLRLFETFASSPKIAVACTFLFCTGSPLGCVIGLLVTSLGDQLSATAPAFTTLMTSQAEVSGVSGTLVATAILECLATGTFLYVTFVEVIPAEFSHGADESRVGAKLKVRKMFKLVLLLFGFALITALQFI